EDLEESEVRKLG
ncbi:hypothetical protein Tco_1169364, partial [Tanacetum coccineum]